MATNDISYDVNCNIRCALVNIQSVSNKTVEIRELIRERKFDVFALTETWLKEHERAKIAEMTPLTHYFFHVPRLNKRGEGVGIFISKEFLQVKLIKSRNFRTFEYIEISFLTKFNKKIVFIVVYRLPNASKTVFLDEFCLFLDDLNNFQRNFYLW